LGVHLLLFSLISVSDNPRSVQMSEEAPGILFFVELPKPIDTQPSTHSSSNRPMSRSAASDNTITLPPGVEGTDALIDWDAEASRVAKDAARLTVEEKQFRSLDQHPAGMGPLPPKRSYHQLGDSLHLEGGVIIDWVGAGCYYSNQDAPIAAFGQALRLQLLTCTGAGGGGGKPFPTIEEWKKERDNR
jgi:hypothetical protein